MKDGCLWPLFYSIFVLPAALIGASLGGGIAYNKEYTTASRIHSRMPEHNEMSNLYEAIGGITFGMPGLVLVGWYHWKARQEKDEENERRIRVAQDETVWPPPPLE